MLPPIDQPDDERGQGMHVAPNAVSCVSLQSANVQLFCYTPIHHVQANSLPAMHNTRRGIRTARRDHLDHTNFLPIPALTPQSQFI